MFCPWCLALGGAHLSTCSRPRRKRGDTEPLVFDPGAAARARLASIPLEPRPERVTYSWPDEPVDDDEPTKV
jgi:hypothetical protein